MQPRDLYDVRASLPDRSHPLDLLLGFTTSSSRKPARVKKLEDCTAIPDHRDRYPVLQVAVIQSPTDSYGPLRLAAHVMRWPPVVVT